MYNSICSFPLSSDLFTQAIHPTSPLLAIGLASGHVQLHQFPALPATSSPRSKAKTASTNGHGTIETAWRTRRHKGSCRSVTFSSDGHHLFSAGTDGIVKAALTETGRVIAKIAVPRFVLYKKDASVCTADSLVRQAYTMNSFCRTSSEHIDPPTLLHTSTPQTLLLATDSSALHLYDLRTFDTAFATPRPVQTHYPHGDYVSSITPLPPSKTSTSGLSKQWVSTGGFTVAVVDVRKGVAYQSDDLGEEILCGTIIGDKPIAGGEKGALRIWDGGMKGLTQGDERRIVVEKGESLDVLCPLPEADGLGETVAVGLGDGNIKFVQVGKKGGVIGTQRHHELEGVVAIGFEPGGRMISGGGDVVQVWERSDDDFVDGGAGEANGALNADSAEDDEVNDSDDSSSEEEMRPKRKKRKRNKGKGRGGSNHIMSFKGMD
ncbi:MAG: hypothetical protein L6R37_001906 [Teloschistes peruensis]|nr:MAG: hypothetical protein L6R37_001906 [Teloschistes peruensis]